MRRQEDERGRCRAAPIGLWLIGCIALAGCSSSSDRLASTIDPKFGVSSSPRVVEPGQPVPKGGGTYRVGKPYLVAGRLYVPQENPNYRSEGTASWYGEDFHGRLTANGEVYDMNAISAAHPTLPMPCYVRVTNLANQRSLIVRINDRGPYYGNREIDLSGKAAHLLGFVDRGVARVRVEYVGIAPLDGSDDRRLIATLRQGEPAPAPSGVMVASAKPFLPEFAGRSPVLRGPVPVPTERPFDLGERSTMHDAAAAADRRAGLQTRSPWLAAPEGTPVAAYAPARIDGSAGLAAATSGRGLY
jgi:rare lipoprotein A